MFGGECGHAEHITPLDEARTGFQLPVEFSSYPRRLTADMLPQGARSLVRIWEACSVVSADSLTPKAWRVHTTFLHRLRHVLGNTEIEDIWWYAFCFGGLLGKKAREMQVLVHGGAM